MATIEGFQKLDIRVGKIIDAGLIPDAKYTTHKLTIDFCGDVGKKVSGARLVRYKKEDLMEKLVLCAINLQTRQIGKFKSEVLTLGVPGKDGECVLIQPDTNVELGGKLF